LITSLLHARALAALLLAAALGACGGGGGGGAEQTYPLRAALDNLTRAGSAFQLTAIGTSATSAVDGDCSGTMNETDGAATIPATFNGHLGWSSSIIASLHFSNCSPADVSASETDYFDSNYLPVGAVVNGGKYGVYLTPPVVPETVSVGSTGTIGTLTFYADSTQTTAAGHADRTYAIEADTATTAIANSISKVYDATGTLTSTSQVRYRIDTKGKLSIVSQDIVQIGTSATTHLVFRCTQSSC
jgi:hypothetical protein